MTALALLCTAVPFPTDVPLNVRLDTEVRTTTNGEPPVSQTRTLETAVAPDGAFRARATFGDRTLSLGGTARREARGPSRGRFEVRVHYADIRDTGAYSPLPDGSRQPLPDISSGETTVRAAVGERVALGRIVTESDERTPGGRVRTRVEEAHFLTLLPPAPLAGESGPP